MLSWGQYIAVLLAATFQWIHHRIMRPTGLDALGELANTRHSSSPSERLIYALRHILLSPLETTPRSDSAKAVIAGRTILAQIEGYVKISDLVNFPDLETSLVNFVALTQDFDSKFLRLDTAYNSIVSHLETLVTTSCNDFHQLLEDARYQLHTHNEYRVGRHPRYETTIATLRHQRLTRRLHETKIYVSVISSSIIQAISTLFDDTVNDMNTYLDLHKSENLASSYAHLAPDSTPTTQIHHPGATPSSTESPILILLEKLSALPSSHPLYITLNTSIQDILTTTTDLQATISSMQGFFFDVDDTLRDLNNVVKGLCMENLGFKSGKIAELMKRLNDVVVKAREQTDTISM